MAAATADRYPERQKSDLVPYTGSSGTTYFAGTLIVKQAGTGKIIPLTVVGTSNAYFLGVANNGAVVSGSSNPYIGIWKTGEFTFDASGTGASAHIGQIAYGIDDKTVGVSSASNLPVGEIVGVPTTTTYRVRIDTYVGNRTVGATIGVYNNL